MFDLEGARKAGYTDAEIAAGMAQREGFDLAGAKSAGYSDGEIIAKLMERQAKAAQAGVIPGAEGEAARLAAVRAQPQPTVGEKLVGTGEAALTAVTGATGGTLGMIGGTLGGLAGSILSGQFGTPEAAKMIEQAASEGAQRLTYAPRTEQGQEQAQALGQAMQQVVPVAAVLPGMAPMLQRPQAPALVRGTVEGVARDVAGAPGAAVAARAIDTTARVANLARTQASTLPRRALEAIRQEQTPTPGTLGSAGAAATDMATQRRALASDLPVPINLTKGQASRDPAQLKFEVEAAKLPEAGAPLRTRLLQQNEAIFNNFDSWIDQTGAQAPNLRAVGTIVDSALKKQADADKVRIRTAYKAAERAGAMEEPVTLSSVVQHLNESAPDAATAPLLDVARRRALRLGIATEVDGQLVPQAVPLKIAETYRQAIGGATDYAPTNIRQATIIKGLVDEATETVGGDLYKQARALRRRYAQNYEDRAVISKLLTNKRGTADRQVAFEDVFDFSILKGSLDDVRNVRRVLQRSGADGEQAWRELQGSTATWIRDQAARNSATDSMGNRIISADALDKAIRQLDADGKLQFIFGKQGAQQMRDIRDLALIARTVPPEAAINTSNTASTLLAGFLDVGGSSALGVPLPAATMYRIIRENVKDRALRSRIEDALGEQAKKAPKKTNLPPGTTLQ